MKNDLGKIHIYTGNGKGKTTAAFGLALRALGAGYRVYVIQFMKGKNSSELKNLKSLPKITIKNFGSNILVSKKGQNKDKVFARQALNWANKIMVAGRCDVIVLDEIFLAVFFNLIPISEITKLIRNKPAGVELILTGRKANSEIIKLADYVTEMKEIKHPYQIGLAARKGIEY